MSKYNIIVKKVEYHPEGNITKESQVYYQEINNDDDVVSRVARAVNSDTVSVAKAPIQHMNQDIDQLLQRVLKLVTGRHLTVEQANLVRTIYAYREIHDENH